MASAVLVLTDPQDETARSVVTELRRRGAAVVAMDTGDFPQRLRLGARNAGGGWCGRLGCVDGDGVDLGRVAAVYYRRPTRFRFPDGLSDADAVFAAAEARYGLGGVLAGLDALWVNDPFRVAAAEFSGGGCLEQ